MIMMDGCIPSIECDPGKPSVEEDALKLLGSWGASSTAALILD